MHVTCVILIVIVSQYQLNEQIQNFIRYFYNHVRQQNVYEIQVCPCSLMQCLYGIERMASNISFGQEIYETTWHKLTDRYFKNQRWPPAEAISPLGATIAMLA